MLFVYNLLINFDSHVRFHFFFLLLLELIMLRREGKYEFFDCGWALFGNRVAGKRPRGSQCILNTG